MKKLLNNEVFSPPLTWRAHYKAKNKVEMKWWGKNREKSACLSSFNLAWCSVFFSLPLHVSFGFPLSSSFKDFWASQITNVRSANMSRWSWVSDSTLSGCGCTKRKKRQRHWLDELVARTALWLYIL